MGEPWTKEQFEDHWYAWAEGRALGVAVLCDCEEDHCHGWRMIVTHIPTPIVLLKEGDPGVMTSHIPTPPLHNGDTVTLTWTMVSGE
jgi:hypothetical protein